MFDQLKNLKGLAGLMGQAGQFKEKMEQMQEELARQTVVGDAGAGAVRVTINGRLEVVRVELDRVMIATLAGPSTPSESSVEDDRATTATSAGQTDQEMVEELIAAAINDGMARAQELVRQEMSKITGGLDLSSMGGPGGFPGLS